MNSELARDDERPHLPRHHSDAAEEEKFQPLLYCTDPASCAKVSIFSLSQM